MARPLRNLLVTGVVLGSTLLTVACSEPDWLNASEADLVEDSDGNLTAPEDCAEEKSDGAACCEDMLPGKAHCVAEADISESRRAGLNTCAGGGRCIPDSIRTGAAPVKCESGVGGEGACVSLCVKSVADKADLLQRSTCGEHERCVPCISPLDDTSTGACEVHSKKTACAKKEAPAPPTTDAGTASAGCCGGKGACIPVASIPEEKAKNLEPKECAEGKLCAPKENLDPAFKPRKCVGTALTGAFDGVCLSTCIDFGFLQKGLSDQGDCDADHRCMPCKTPLGTKSGAPGCE